jgi:hypothetical protein
MYSKNANILSRYNMYQICTSVSYVKVCVFIHVSRCISYWIFNNHNIFIFYGINYTHVCDLISRSLKSHTQGQLLIQI